MKIETLRQQEKVTLTVGNELVEFSIQKAYKAITVRGEAYDTSGDIKLIGTTISGKVINSGIIAGQNGLDLFLLLITDDPVKLKKNQQK